MLTFIVPTPSAVRAISHIPRRLRSKHFGSAFGRSASTSSLSDTVRDEQDAQGNNDRASGPRLQNKNAAFSHFFDARTPRPTTTNAASSGKHKASHEVASASRQAVADFRQCLSTREPAKIIQAYGLLVQAQQNHAEDIQNHSSNVQEPSQIGFPVRKADVQTAVRYLVQHAQTRRRMDSDSFEACQQMFKDMSQRFCFRIGPTDLHRQLHAHVLSDISCAELCDVFEQLRTDHPEWKTTTVDWDMVISHLANRRSYKLATKLWNDMVASGVEAHDDLRRTMARVEHAINKTAAVEDSRQQFAQGEAHPGRDNLPATVMSLSERVSASDKTDPSLMNALRAHASELRRYVDSSSEAAADTVSWNALLHYEAVITGPAHALQTARQAFKVGLFDRSTLDLLLRLHTDELRELQSSDEALDLLDRVQSAIDPKRTIQPDDQCYNILMLGLLNGSASEDATAPSPNQVREAQLLYDHVRGLGLAPTPLLVTPLLTAYCEAFLPSLPSAIKLVDDLLEHRASSLPSTRKSSSSTRAAIDMAIIGPVVDACVKLKDISSARALLSRLHEAGIFMSATDKSQLMRRLIGITTSWPEAFQIYRSLSRFRTWSSASPQASHPGLDARGYMSLLESLRALTFPDSRSTSSQQSMPAPPEELLGIVEDMRSAGHPPSCAIYTSILDYYSKTPQPSYVGVQATHEMLKRDEGLEPDLPLINALMNAYNYVGEPAMVLAIWDSLIATRQEIDGVTLSVFFDTAGKHGLLSLARKAISTVRRIEAEGNGEGRRSAMSKGAWDSWLECLARCGRLEEAIELAFGEMRRTLFREAIDSHAFDGGEQQRAGLTVTELLIRSTQAPVKDRRGHAVGPDAKTFGVLLRFAARERDRRQKRFTAGLLSGPTSNEARSGVAGGGGNSIWHTLRTRIREELSWLYPQIKHIGEQPSL